MVKQLLGYSLVSYLWRNYDLTMSDIFLPLVLKLIHKNFRHTMHITSLQTLHKSFLGEYNINLPVLNIIGLLNRDKTGSIKYSDGFYTLYQDRFREVYPDLFSERREKAINEAYESIKIHAREKYEIEYSIEEVEKSASELLLNLPKTLFQDMNITLNAPQYSQSVLHRIIADYISNCEPERVNVFHDIFLGSILSHVIGLKENQEVDLYENSSKVFNECVIYIDTPILIPLMKAADESISSMYNELIEILKKAGATIKTFSHIVREVESILKVALRALQDNVEISGKLSPATLYFMNNRDEKNHLVLLANNAAKYISEELKINIVDAHLDDQREYMIDTGKLEDFITDIYSKNQHADYFDMLRYKTPINTDVQSIAAIQCFRKGVVPMQLVDSKHLLLTKNWGLLKAANEYKEENDQSVSLEYIILIDTYISTIIWNVQEKPIIGEYYKQRLIADCLNVISPDPDFINEFKRAVKDYSSKSYLSDEETKLMMLKPEYVNAAYMKCGPECTNIHESIDEIKERMKIALTGPLNDKINELHNKLQKEKNMKSQLEEEVELKDKTIALTHNEIEEKNGEITKLKNVNKGYKDIIDFANFKKDKWLIILIKYITQKPVIIEIFLGLIPIVVSILTAWWIVILDILYLIVRKVFKLDSKYKMSTYNDIAQKLFEIKGKDFGESQTGSE